MRHIKSSKYIYLQDNKTYKKRDRLLYVSSQHKRLPIEATTDNRDKKIIIEEISIKRD